MPTPVLWKNPFQVNTDDAAIGVQVDPRIIGLAGGKILVVWTESVGGGAGTGAGSNIIGRIYSASGFAEFAPFQINSRSTVDDERDFDIAATNDGGFVIVYVDDDIGSANQTGIIWERYDSDRDVVVTELIAVENIAADFFANPQVTVNQQTNESLVTFTDDVGADTDVRAVTVSAAGVASAEFDAALNSADFDGDGDVAILASGLFVSVYREGGATLGAQAHIMSRTGFEVATFDLTTEPVSSVRVAGLANGNWVAVWCETTGGNPDIRYQVFSPVGDPVSGPVPLFAAAGANSQDSPDVTALPDGGFVIVWDDDTAGELRARRFNADGSGDGTLFTVATGADSVPDVGVTGDGRILFTWKDGETAEIFASIWDPRGPVINAGDYNDDDRIFADTLRIDGGLTGTTINGDGIDGLLIFGQSGDDVMNGGANAQNLQGGGGNDVLNGGAGDDVLAGGSGTDTMNGGSGDDQYLVDLADVVIEAAGGGYDQVFASADYTLAEGVHVEELATTGVGGSAPLALGGNNFENVIYGNAGNNILYGKGGFDTLFGLGGNDIYYVSDAGDFIVELSGGGSDRILTSVDYSLNDDAHVETLSTDSNAGTSPIALGGNNLENILIGNDGANILYGKGGFDTIYGRAGDDVYYVSDAGDLIVELTGEGNDRIFASVDYTLFDDGHVETLSTEFIAGTANLSLGGNNLANIVIGNNGNNILYGKGGADTLYSHGGSDTFLFTSMGAGDVDTIADFAAGSDKIAFYASVFTALAPGTLSASAFVTGSAATTASHRIIHNQATGALFYDADGNGAGAAVQFASVTPGMTLGAGDFIVL